MSEADVDAAIAATRAGARRTLLAAYADGAFRGELSSSALSTATATIALELLRRRRPDGVDAVELATRVRAGLAWLGEHANEDGGFGDTVDSPSNVSTTALTWAATGLGGAERRDVAERAAAWLTDHAGGTDVRSIGAALAKRYGEDLTFSVPILTACTLAGRFGRGPHAWRAAPALPFELAALPRRWFRRLGLPVVSYALPALIALGQVRHAHAPSRNPIARAARALARRRTLRVLEEVQPGHGGFLEAAPLTSFVLMSLVGLDLADHPVARRAAAFLRTTVRSDGSWPIDTNLDTWTTTLAVKAFAAGGDDVALDAAARARTVRRLLDQQGRAEHPYTLAAPGAWAWTDLEGGVPDADDTPGALLALHHLAPDEPATAASAAAGVRWLVDLANRDGGIPTFCRGFGKLPFDRSSPDLTAHTLRAWRAWRGRIDEALGRRVDAARTAAVRFLIRTQGADGTWVPLWFGNQAAPREENPLYGTAQVVLALADEPEPEAREAVRRGVAALLEIRNEDGGFGGARDVRSSIEETATALHALAHVARTEPDAAARARLRDGPLADAACCLADATRGGTRFPAAPIGLYFARLWYSERLYPVLFTVAALESFAALPATPHK